MKHPFSRKSSARSNSAKTSKISGLNKPLTFGFKQAVGLAIVASLALFGASGYYWYKYVFIDTDRILSDMLDKSMQTTSLYRNIAQEGNGSNVDQDIYASFTPQLFAQSQTTLQESSGKGKTSVDTETIGTEKSDYVRYTSIAIANNKAAEGKKYEDIINQWAKRDENLEEGQSLTFLNDSLFVVVPFGNLNSDQRQKVKNEIIKTKLYDVVAVKTHFLNGRPVATYSIKMNPQSLVKVLAKYVEVTGIGKSAQLDPAQYEGAEALGVVMEVDMLSRHVSQVQLTASGRTESYYGYNVSREINLPKQTIPVDELQTRLTKLESQL